MPLRCPHQHPATVSVRPRTPGVHRSASGNAIKTAAPCQVPTNNARHPQHAKHQRTPHPYTRSTFTGNSIERPKGGHRQTGTSLRKVAGNTVYWKFLWTMACSSCSWHRHPAGSATASPAKARPCPGVVGAARALPAPLLPCPCLLRAGPPPLPPSPPPATTPSGAATAATASIRLLTCSLRLRLRLHECRHAPPLRLQLAAPCRRRRRRRGVGVHVSAHLGSGAGRGSATTMNAEDRTLGGRLVW